MDTERSRRHASKLLTYPITIGSVLHRFSGMNLSNQRVTPEGSRSLAGKVFSTFNVVAILNVSSISTSNDIARSTWRARNGGRFNHQASNENIYSRRTSRVIVTTPRMGATLLALPVRTIPSFLHRSSSVTPQTS